MAVFSKEVNIQLVGMNIHDRAIIRVSFNYIDFRVLIILIAV